MTLPIYANYNDLVFINFILNKLVFQKQRKCKNFHYIVIEHYGS